MQHRIERRLEATRAARIELPKLIQVRELNRLEQFEEDVLAMLTGTAISPVLRAMLAGESRHHDMASLPIRKLLMVLCPSFQEQIKRRRHFYKSSKLLSKSLVKVEVLSRHALPADLLDQNVVIDRRMLDFIVGLQPEMEELVQGSGLAQH